MIMNEYAFLVMTGTIEAELESRAAEGRLIGLARSAEEGHSGAEREAAMPKERMGAGACYC